MSTGEFSDATSWAGRPVALKIADAISGPRVVVTGSVRSAPVVDRGGTLPKGDGRRKRRAERSEQRA